MGALQSKDPHTRAMMTRLRQMDQDGHGAVDPRRVKSLVSQCMDRMTTANDRALCEQAAQALGAMAEETDGAVATGALLKNRHVGMFLRVLASNPQEVLEACPGTVGLRLAQVRAKAAALLQQKSEHVVLRGYFRVWQALGASRFNRTAPTVLHIRGQVPSHSPSIPHGTSPQALPLSPNDTDFNIGSFVGSDVVMMEPIAPPPLTDEVARPRPTSVVPVEKMSNGDGHAAAGDTDPAAVLLLEPDADFIEKALEEMEQPCLMGRLTMSEWTCTNSPAPGPNRLSDPRSQQLASEHPNSRPVSAFSPHASPPICARASEEAPPALPQMLMLDDSTAEHVTPAVRSRSRSQASHGYHRTPVDARSCSQVSTNFLITNPAESGPTHPRNAEEATYIARRRAAGYRAQHPMPAEKALAASTVITPRKYRETKASRLRRMRKEGMMPAASVRSNVRASGGRRSGNTSTATKFSVARAAALDASAAHDTRQLHSWLEEDSRRARQGVARKGASPEKSSGTFAAAVASANRSPPNARDRRAPQWMRKLDQPSVNTFTHSLYGKARPRMVAARGGTHRRVPAKRAGRASGSTGASSLDRTFGRRGAAGGRSVTKSPAGTPGTVLLSHASHAATSVQELYGNAAAGMHNTSMLTGVSNDVAARRRSPPRAPSVAPTEVTHYTNRSFRCGSPARSMSLIGMPKCVSMRGPQKQKSPSPSFGRPFTPSEISLRGSIVTDSFVLRGV
eukprot:TRINITY_DN678_c0_g1_i1.p1 TRINITY_DN678_c0_g1~~TRINITY_DN678_c0_g1_i1.p1  ORF type:complete len:736 (+),score=228.54 TRINITY_DN678_c0_g1_i1:59-2266(+)